MLQSILQLRQYEQTAKSQFQVFLKEYIQYIYKYWIHGRAICGNHGNYQIFPLKFQFQFRFILITQYHW